MREILTIIAACIVAVLAAALAVPPFVDWNSHSTAIAARLGAGFGGAVTLEGPVRLRLLPAPRLTVGALTAERAGLQLRAQNTSLELSAPALLRGAFEFTEIALSAADVTVDATQLEGSAGAQAQIAVANFRLSDATLRLAGAQPLVLAHVDMSGSADSLAGPFRGQGVWSEGDPVDFAFSTARIEDGRLKAKLSFDVAAIKLHGEATGDLAFERGAPSFAGQGLLMGALGSAPARASFALRADAQTLHADKIDARLGDDDHALNFSGAADFSRGNGIDARLEASSLDLDRFRNAHSISSLGETARSIPLRAKLSADSVLLGGDTLTSVALDLSRAANVAPKVVLDAGLPGRTRLHYDGRLEVSRANLLEGALKLETRDPAKLAAWLSPAAPQAARWLAAASVSRLAYDGDLRSEPSGVTLAARAFELDRSRLSGAIDWRNDAASGRDKVTARLRASVIDIDSLPDVRALASVSAADDLDLMLDADALRVARLGEAPAETGNLRVVLSRAAGVAELRELSIRNLGGASLSGSGRATPQGGGFDLRLDAERLADLAALLRRIAPGGASEALAARALALSPAHLSFGVATDASGAFTQFNLAGEAGGARWSAQAQPAGAGRMQARVSAQAPEAAILLRQAGLSVLPLKGLGGARLEAQGEGGIGGALQTRASLDIAGLALRFEGDTEFALDHASAKGKLTADSGDLAPLAPLFFIGAPDVGHKIPLHGGAQMRLDAQGLALEKIIADAAGALATGSLTRDKTGAIGGALKLDVLSAPDLVALVLGPPQPAAAGALWPSLKFAPARFDLPKAEIAMDVARLDLGADARARDARFRLKLAPGSVAVSDLAMTIGEGRASGEVALRREGGAATASARLAGEGLRASAGPLSARIDGALQVSGAGGSMAELVSSLAGAGRLRFADAQIAGAAPDAVSRIVKDAEASEAAIEPRDVTARLQNMLDGGAQALPSFESESTIATGRLAVAPLRVQLGAIEASLSGSFDLRTAELGVREILSLPAPQGFASAPRIELSWGGVSSAVRRDVNADALIASLAERAIEREKERNAALEADIRERAFFNRRLKMDRRNDEERRALEDARRLLAPPPPASSPAPRAQTQPDVPARPTARPPAAFTPAARGAAPDPSTAGRY